MIDFFFNYVIEADRFFFYFLKKTNLVAIFVLPAQVAVTRNLHDVFSFPIQ